MKKKSADESKDERNRKGRRETNEDIGRETFEGR